MVMYARSQLDKNNFNWFSADMSKGTLRSIELRKGAMRGLAPFIMKMDYPITAVAGSNGAGKSTLLALAACAFHNFSTGYKPDNSKQTYYTFSDFFIQSAGELPPQGVQIRYGIQSNQWVGKKGRLVHQTRKKAKGGKWNDYDLRIDRDVIYFGVQRVVPYFERSVYKSYRRYFKAPKAKALFADRIRDIAGRIIGRTYADLELQTYKKYSLPVVTVGTMQYSGFNMGAGESAVFDILTALFTAGMGTLLVIDEIELGLHEAAQYRLIDELKKLCEELHCQIICSTHSHAVLSSLPPEARFFLDNVAGKTMMTKGITSEFACGTMGQKHAQELDILVEDPVSEDVMKQWLPKSLRKRVNILPIGSHTALETVMASRWLEGRKDLICVMDGDQRGDNAAAISRVVKATQLSQQADKDAVKAWASAALHYLPTNDWPERWLLGEANVLHSKRLLNGAQDLADAWGLEGPNELDSLFQTALQAGKHKEFHALGEAQEFDEERVRSDVVRVVHLNGDKTMDAVVDAIRSALKA